MTTVLYVNHAHSTVCGIHDLGVRHVELLRESSELLVCYVAANSTDVFTAAYDACQPNVVIFNFRADLMPWVTSVLPALAVPSIGIIHNYSPSTISLHLHALLRQGFTYGMVLDETIAPTAKLLVTGRSIPKASDTPATPHSAPIIGSFGFAFPHKGFPKVAKAVNDSFDRATVRLQAPEAFFNGVNGGRLYTDGIMDACRAAITKPGIGLEHDGAVLDGLALVRRLADNDINCLLYDPGQPDAGISSALDYLIAAQRPILVTDCEMFAPAMHGLALWPNVSPYDIMHEYSTYRWRALELYEQMASRLLPTTEMELKRVLA